LTQHDLTVILRRNAFCAPRQLHHRRFPDPTQEIITPVSISNNARITSPGGPRPRSPFGNAYPGFQPGDGDEAMVLAVTESRGMVGGGGLKTSNLQAQNEIEVFQFSKTIKTI